MSTLYLPWRRSLMLPRNPLALGVYLWQPVDACRCESWRWRLAMCYVDWSIIIAPQSSSVERTWSRSSLLLYYFSECCVVYSSHELILYLQNRTGGCGADIWLTGPSQVSPFPFWSLSVRYFRHNVTFIVYWCLWGAVKSMRLWCSLGDIYSLQVSTIPRPFSNHESQFLPFIYSWCRADLANTWMTGTRNSSEI